jgi:hypothetical protein
MVISVDLYEGLVVMVDTKKVYMIAHVLNDDV